MIDGTEKPIRNAQRDTTNLGIKRVGIERVVFVVVVNFCYYIIISG